MELSQPIPEEVLRFHIFSYFDGDQDKLCDFRVVCSHWNNVIPIPCVVVTPNKWRDSNARFSTVFSRGHHVRTEFLLADDGAPLLDVFRALKSNTTVTKLTLHRENLMTSRCAYKFGRLLIQNTTLRHLSLQNCSTASEPFRFIKNALLEHTSLRSLEIIRAAPHVMKILPRVASSLPFLTSIVTSGSEYGRHALTAVERLGSTPVDSLSVQLDTMSKEASLELFLRSLSTNTVLRSLEIAENKLGNAGAHQLASTLSKMTSLRNLRILHCSMGLVGVLKLLDSLPASLLSLTVVERAVVAGADFSSNAINFLDRSAKIHFLALDIASCKVSSDVKRAAKAHPALRKLSLQGRIYEFEKEQGE